MSLKPTAQRLQGTLVGLTVALALVVGGVVDHDIGHSDATTAGGVRLQAIEQNATVKVPFLGPFAYHHKGYAQCGPGVRLMEGALRNTTPPVRKANAQSCIGTATQHQLIVFQNRHHIPPSGIYGLRTHEALAHAYTAEQRAGLTYLAANRLKTARYREIGIITSHAYTQRDSMQYCDHGALAQCGLRGVWPPWPDVPHNTDCSGYVSWVYYQAGIPNPNLVGVGTTKTLINQGHAISPKALLKVGDLVFYGENNSHVAIYIGHGLVSSHGQPGLDIHPYNYRVIFAIRRYF